MRPGRPVRGAGLGRGGWIAGHGSTAPGSDDGAVSALRDASGASADSWAWTPETVTVPALKLSGKVIRVVQLRIY